MRIIDDIETLIKYQGKISNICVSIF